jgi:2-C-methyl-D-erythritol 4-phosphate cytidylyltransferase/2-C-methyl-D-erythritol 2,4-cyclodiphosphate synthase
MMSTAALIVAAGCGERAGGGVPKQFQMLLGQPVLLWSVDAMLEAGVDPIVVVVAPEQVEASRSLLAGSPATVVSGGATRTASVRAGLLALNDPEIVLIHDAARPGLTTRTIHHLIAAIRAGATGAAPALPVADALHRIDALERVTEEVDRVGLMRVQTPQAFRLSAIRAAYAAAPVGQTFTDDIAVARASNVDVVLVPGDLRLMKLTFREDFAMIEHLMGAERFTCVGAGIDAHRFGPGDYVTLCGVRIAHDKGLIGLSDADAGWHALVDAILGALGEGDIGAHFPPSDPQWKGADSAAFLRHAAALSARAGARIQHVDVTLLCERPKIGPHREAMRARTAEVLGIPLHRVSVKATTTEGLGFLGREEGLAAQATATLDRPA